MSPDDKFVFTYRTTDAETFRWGGREYSRYFNGSWAERLHGGTMMRVAIPRRIKELDDKYEEWRLQDDV